MIKDLSDIKILLSPFRFFFTIITGVFMYSLFLFSSSECNKIQTFYILDEIVGYYC